MFDNQSKNRKGVVEDKTGMVCLFISLAYYRIFSNFQTSMRGSEPILPIMCSVDELKTKTVKRSLDPVWNKSVQIRVKADDI